MKRKRLFYQWITAVAVCCLILVYYVTRSELGKVGGIDRRPLRKFSLNTDQTESIVVNQVTVSPLSNAGNIDDSQREWYARLKTGRKIIILYTTWFGQQQWSDLTGNRLYQSMEACTRAKNCLLTYDKGLLNQAAGLVFHGRDVEMGRNAPYSPDKLRELRKAVPQSQKWTFLSHENPQRNVGIYKPFDGVFNWTATFSRAADVFAPYQEYTRAESPLEQVPNYASGKTRLVGWAVSNCNSKLRLDYVQQLEKYIDVVVYGACNRFFKNKGNCGHHFDKSCATEMATFKFYLAFENDFCHDYVTEKYWERIHHDVVPVVLGANYDDGVAIPGSYIDVNDFSSIKQLSEYLLYLDKNDTAYNKFFEYKNSYVGSGDGLYCKICEKLNSDAAKQQSQVTLSEAFNYENSCGVYRTKVEKLRKQITESASM